MKQIQDGAEWFCEAKHAGTFNADNQARIKSIIFLELEEVAKIQTIPKLYPHSRFKIYLSDYSYHLTSRWIIYG